MVFDSISILACVILVLLAVMSSLSDVFLKKLPTNGAPIGDSETGKPVSVIIISDNNARELRNNLPLFLSQNHRTGYEVIVVVVRDEDGTSDVLKSFADSPYLYTTFVPDTSRYMSKRKLAITLGTKAAKNEWVLLTDATCRPTSDNWINSMSSACRDDVDMVLGYSNYSDDAGHFKSFYRLRKEYALFIEASKTAYGMDGNNLMFRRNVFMNGNGFQGNLKYLRGEYYFIVNKYAEEGRVVVNTCVDAFLLDTPPTKKEWHNKNVFYCETRRHLFRSFRHRMLFCFDMFSFHLSLVVGIAMTALSLMYSWWLILPFSVVALVMPIVFRLINATRVIRQFRLFVPIWKIIPFEFHILWHNLKYIIAYNLSDKYEYISHKS